jgi:polyhydroxybutyrate depolymerase
VVDGSYRVRLPPAPAERPFGAIVFFHGWQQTAEDVMNDQPLTAIAARLGIALVALNGEQKTWSFPSSPHHYRDDFEYVHAVLEDLVKRFPIDRRQLLGAGFSQGASMIWYLACRQPHLFAAFAPVSGAFWRPAPRTCAAPLPVLLHLHGLADATVPLEGREVAPGVRQDSIRDSFAILGPSAPLHVLPRVKTGFISETPLTCERSARQRDGGLLEFCIHSGGHQFIAAWIEHAWHLSANVRHADPGGTLLDSCKS